MIHEDPAFMSEKSKRDMQRMEIRDRGGVYPALPPNGGQRSGHEVGLGYLDLNQ